MANKSLGKVPERQRMRIIKKKLDELQTTYGVEVSAILCTKPYPQGVVSEEEILEKKFEEAKELTSKLNEIMKVGEVPKDLGVDALKKIDYMLDLKLKEIDELLEAKKAEKSQSNAAEEGTK